MNSIKRQSFHGIEYLGAEHYLQAIVQEGCQIALMDSRQLESLQYQIAGLLADRFNRWTCGQSSSVPVETGRQIQESAFYTIGYYLKSLKDGETALNELKNCKLQEIYDKGARMIETDCAEAKKLLRAVREECFSTDILAYNDSLWDGFSMFFSTYDADYEAQETPASIDYPLGNDKMNLTGIEYVSSYLTKLQLENEFCAYFSNDDIHGLLRGYDLQYKELLFNIYDLVFTNAVGGILLSSESMGSETGVDHDRDVRMLNISDPERLCLQKNLTPLSQKDLEGIVDKAVSRLCAALPVTNQRLADYLRLSAANLKSRLSAALENGQLAHLFLSVKDETISGTIWFEDAASLDPVNFRKLADEIRECRKISDKLILLHSQPLSMKDFMGLLEGDCFFGEEYADVFRSLEDSRLALLIKEMPLYPESNDFLHEEFEQDWQRSFDSFLAKIDTSRRSALLALAGRIGMQMNTD